MLDGGSTKEGGREERDERERAEGGREGGREVGRWEERSGAESSADGMGRHVGHAGGEDTVTHYILTRASSAVSICAFVLVKQVKRVPAVHRRLSVRLPHPAARAPLCASTALHHTSVYVSIRPHTSAYVSIALCGSGSTALHHTSAYVSIRQHTSAYVSIRQHTSAYVSIRQHTPLR
jgi:hypothetical protein